MTAGPLGLLAIGPVVDTGGPGAGSLVIGVGCLLAAAYALTPEGPEAFPTPTTGVRASDAPARRP